jgi:hypothetical protein
MAQPTACDLSEIVWGETRSLLQGTFHVIFGKSVAEDQGETFGDLGAGLTSHGILAAELGLGQLHFRWAEGLLQQAGPLVQQALAGFFGPIR